jgi:hypothetical protein
VSFWSVPYLCVDDHDEMAHGPSRAERNENGQGNGYSRGTIGKLDNIQDVIDNTRRREEAKKTPDHLNPVMWAKEWAADIMRRQGYTNPFAEPEPKNNVEKGFFERVGNWLSEVRWGAVVDASVGIVGNALGVVIGAVIVAEPLDLTHYSRAIGYGVYSKSVWGLGANVCNLVQAFTQKTAEFDVPSSAHDRLLL